MGEDAEALLLHDLLIKGAEAEHSLEESLELIGVAPDEMEFIFIDYEDLAEDLMDTFDDYEDLAEDLIDTFDELEEEEEIPTLTEAMEHLEAVDPFLAEDTKALVLHDLLIKGAEAEHSLEESLALIAVDRDEMESIFSEHYSLAKDVMDAFDELKEEEKLPTLAEAMEQLEALDLHHGKDTEALVLHDLLLKGSAVQFSLEGALELINVDYDEMESIFTDHDDLAEDVLDAYIDLENENAEIGAQVVRYLEEHIIQDEDGNLLFQGSGEDPVNEHQEHHRRLEHLRNLRWEKYYSEREMLPKKLKEHGAFLKRHLADLSGCDDQDEAMCFSEELEIYEEEIEELVLVMEDELGPFMDVMGALDKAVGSVKSVASVIGTLETICKVLKLLPGFFGTLFNLAYNFFTTLDVSWAWRSPYFLSTFYL